ncbi:MAG: TIGR04282 family arsenosugar biosynthesis glycosyltransferase [Aeromicrobium sp.]|nr:TIGR04282 family arsenosugar biosynthesis glycosyltransferase [Burkholderiales bacterium]
MASETCVVIFAKAPIPGEVKTRLIPALGSEGAAMLHAALVERAVETASRTKFSVEICCTPTADDAFFEDCAEEFNCDLSDQGDGSLGERMLRSFETLLPEFKQVVIVGADCPAVTGKHIRAAAASLAMNDVVLIPADDGGYVLIAARRTVPAMFDGIDWGTDTVLAQQRNALHRTGLVFIELETLWDVDRPEDLSRLATLNPPLLFSLPT